MQKIVWLILLFLSINAQGQQKKMTDVQLNTLISKAVTNYPAIKEMEEQMKAFPIKEGLAKSAYQPGISTDINYRYNDPVSEAQFGPNKVQFAPYNNYSATIGINQLIYDFGKTKVQLEKSNAEMNLFMANFDNTKNAIAYQVAGIYYTIIFVHQAMNVQQQQIDVLKENEKIINAKYLNGEALRYDVLSTQVKTSTATNKLTDLKMQLDKQFVLLEWLTGEKQKESFNYVYTEDQIKLITNIDNWQNTNENAILTQKKLALLAFEKKYASIQSRPSLIGNLSGGYRNGIQPNIETIRPISTIGVGLAIPINSTSRPKMQARLAQVSINATKKSFTTIEAGIQKDINIVLADYHNLEEKTVTTNLLVNQAEQAFQLAQVRFKAGLITSAELLSSQSNVEEAKLQQVQLQYLMQLDKLESNKIIGTKLW